MAVTTAERLDVPRTGPVPGTGTTATAPTLRLPVPCAARPGTALRHLDGPCRCFVGGPPPEFAPSVLPG